MRNECKDDGCVYNILLFFLPGLPLGGTGSLIADYSAPLSLNQRSMFSDIPPTPGSGSITLPGSLESK